MSGVLGTGLAFPLGVDQRGAIALVGGETDIAQAISIILATAPGERPMRPEFGCAVHDHVFDVLDPAAFGAIESAVRQAIERWEPRATVVAVDFDLDARAEGRLDIVLTYEIPEVPGVRNLVHPFYVIPEEELEDLSPEEAVEELLARMLEYRRYSDASKVLADRFESQRGYLYRSAPLPAELRRVAIDAATAVYDPDRLGTALGDLLTEPPEVDISHIRPTVSLERRLRALRDVLRARSSFDFDEEFGGEDRLTQAVTVFGLLELYRKGEVTWEQDHAFGPIRVKKVAPTAEISKHG